MKKAVVVGASSGIGREVACLLLRQGWMVGLAARRHEALQSLSDVCRCLMSRVTMPPNP